MQTTFVEQYNYETERGKPMPSKNHSIVQANLIVALAVYRNQYLFMSEISLDLNGWQTTPDIGIFPKMKVDFNHDKIRIAEAPLGIVEILSPAQSIQDLYDKAVQYFEAGVKSVWLVIPTLRTIVVYQSPEQYEMFSSKELIDKTLNITLQLNEIFTEE